MVLERDLSRCLSIFLLLLVDFKKKKADIFVYPCVVFFILSVNSKLTEPIKKKIS